MIDTLKKIWNSKSGNFIFILFIVMLGGIYLYIDRPFVNSIDDLVEVNGTCRQINQEIVYSRKVNKTEGDSTYHIFLAEYPCKFQVSYSSYDSRDFYRNTAPGDKIKLYIARQNEKYLVEPDKKIRSFSLSVNSKTYLSADKGLTGFGTGLFELTMILLPLILMAFLIPRALKK